MDLACGEGVYAIETALRGAKVLAVDARAERMNRGKEAAERLGLANLQFEKNDIRCVSVASHGEFDVVYFLGILYHLDVPEVFQVLENIYEMCREVVIIDTHISLTAQTEVKYKEHTYAGVKWREHGDDDPESVRKSKLLSSLDNTFSFWFTKESLIRLLNDIGFTSVFECYCPLDPVKPGNRVTLVAVKGTRVKISAYPWVNDKIEEEIKAILLPAHRTVLLKSQLGTFKRLLKVIVNGALRPLGYELRRL